MRRPFDGRHHVNHIHILQLAVHPPRAMPRLGSCGSNQSAVVLLHQMLTLPCNTEGGPGLDAVSLWALGYGLCPVEGPYHLRGDLCWRRVVPLRQGALICAIHTR
jgi:hypothetical protein